MAASAPSTIYLQSLPSSALPVRVPDGPGQPDPKAHHLPTNSGFVNPWPSFERNPDSKIGLAGAWDMLRGNPNAVPVPQDPKDRPVQLVRPVWDHGPDGIKMTWIGHASWLVEFPSSAQETRGITLLLDPVWSERTSPVSFAGPKRYTPTPCLVSELPFIDGIAISHSHYDHLDIHTLNQLIAQQAGDPHGRRLRLFLPLGNKKWAMQNLNGVRDEDVVELDWWDGVELSRASTSPASQEESLKIQCTPSQHFSGRTPTNINATLWCGWLFSFSKASPVSPSTAQEPHLASTTPSAASPTCDLTLFFAGDTGYRYVPSALCKPRFSPESPYPGKAALDTLPRNPTFAWIGQNTRIDAALLPVGLFNPIEWQANVHCSPWDSVDVHVDLKTRLSVAMHYGTVRGGLSASYEPIDMPLNELRAACEREGVAHRQTTPGERFAVAGPLAGSTPEGADRTARARSDGSLFAFCDVGETVVVV